MKTLNREHQRRFRAAAALSLALCAGGAATAQSITPLFAGGNNGTAGGIVFFDVNVTGSALNITSFDVNTLAVASSTFGFRAYPCPGTRVGNEQNAAAWTQVANGIGTAAGSTLPS